MESQSVAGVPPLSVVVCTYSRSNLLQSCLASLIPQASSNGVEIVVVNDGSTDNTGDLLKEYGLKITAAGWSQNRGLNAARNEGIRIARSDVVLFFDDDQIAPEGYLAKMLAALQTDCDGVGGPVWDRGQGLRTCDSCAFIGDVTLGDEARDSWRLLGGNMAVRKSAFSTVGPFEERLSGRGDESEWFMRAKDLRFCYDPGLWAWHRRDTFGWTALCAHGLRQGAALPVLDRIVGGASTRQHFSKAIRYFSHAAFRRCSHGLELACRELGAVLGAIRLRGS